MKNQDHRQGLATCDHSERKHNWRADYCGTEPGAAQVTERAKDRAQTCLNPGFAQQPLQTAIWQGAKSETECYNPDWGLHSIGSGVRIVKCAKAVKAVFTATPRAVRPRRSIATFFK